MQVNFSLQQWLEAMRHIAPITGMLHVGAGMGNAVARYAEWGVPAAVLVEASEEHHDKLASIASSHPGWSAHQAVLAERAEEISFYVASNVSESGIIAPENLAGLWRNLKTKEQRRISSTPLKALFDSLGPRAGHINWAVIDCLPALPILKGAQAILENWDVLAVRAVLDETQSVGQGTSKAEIDSFLQAHGYQPIAVEEERQPAVGMVLYVRNWKAVLNVKLTAATEAKEQQTNLANDRHLQLEQLTKARDEQAQLANDRQQQLEQLTKARDEQVKLANDRHLQLEQLTKARDEQAQLANDRHLQLEQLTKARDEQAKLANDRHLQLEQLTKARDEQTKLANDRQQQLEQLTKARDEQTKLANDRQQQLEQLTKLRDEQTKLANDRHLQLEQLTKARDEQAKLANDRHLQLEQLTKARDEQTKLANDRHLQLEQLTKARDEQTKLANDRQQQLEQLTKARDEQAKLANDRHLQLEQLTKARDEQAKLANDRHQQIEQLTKARDEQTKLANDRHQQLEQLTKARDEQTKITAERQTLHDKAVSDSAQQVGQITELLKIQQTRLDKMEQGLRQQITKGLENSTKQIESFIGIETYLSRGQLLPALHGWPISADFALYLINLLEKNNYDLILEFGSGASTVLMASAIVKQLQRHPMVQVPHSENDGRHFHRNIGSDGEHHFPTHIAQENVNRSVIDLVPRVVTFEHHRQYFDETREKLHQAGVAEVVELIHAPLQDYATPSGEQFLYYDCEKKIAEIATLLDGRKAKILLLVDGPPGATCKLARYPALPIVLRNLATHRLDVLMDDFDRQDEKEIVSRWSDLLTKRSLAHKMETFAFEKGACLISVN
ncbi:hypothetical protein [Janthinobacterium sp. 17J80-10]|uniref:hypothetical protein n=1 Tax=Janthinobacterium sp. 17J80-10 TaxID=2497863 RepID=UPI0010053174|nr:hypothetical protein [Janthinobacterium sp. 17J80-10]QAU35535.1 hypothetical protein EKL02_15945 [Janthinobacterium sp. 17J80-10]